MPDLPLTGGCMCGAVRYEISEPLVGSAYCHCTRCQRRTGSAASCSALARTGTFRLVEGESSVGRWTPEGGFTKAFCAECGSAVFGHHPDRPETVIIRMGTFDGDPGVRPVYRQFTDYAAVWEPIPDDGLPRHPEAAPAA